MALNLFGVTPDAVQRHHFPFSPTFDGTTVPTSATVTEIITAQAARLEGMLQEESIEPDTITDASSSAYLWCADTLRLMAAPWVVYSGLLVEDALLVRLETERDARLAELDDNGFLALGDGVSAPSIEANGPTTHLDTYGIELPDASESSPIRCVLRRDDEL